MSALLAKIGQLAVFLICAQTLIHFRPKDSYEKYIKLLVSMMLLILLVEPLMNLLGKGKQGDFIERVQEYESQLQEILGNPELKASDIEVMIQDITRQRAEEAYAKECEREEKVPVSGTVDANEKEEVDGPEQFTHHASEEIHVQIDVKTIQMIELGGEYGQTTENY